jgi:hypothetical protein
MATEEEAESEKPPHSDIAGMYARWALDVVVRLAQEGIATDFVSRPRQYGEVDGGVAQILGDFCYRSGTDPDFPDLGKRELILLPILGPSDGLKGEHASEFHMVSGALRAAADAFANRIFSTGEEFLRNAFRDAAVTFQSYLRPFESSAAAANTDRQSRSAFEKAVRVLLDAKVTGVFGRPQPAKAPNWPLGGSFDDNGALVIKHVSEALDTSAGPIPESAFIVMQRIADFGQRTIQGVLNGEFDTNDRADSLIQLTYRWKTALDELGRSIGSTASAGTAAVGVVGEASAPAELPEATILRPAELMRR